MYTISIHYKTQIETHRVHLWIILNRVTLQIRTGWSAPSLSGILSIAIIGFGKVQASH